MWNLFWNTIVPMLVTAIIIIYHYEVQRPQQKEKQYSLYQSWVDFIKVNIDSCKCPEQAQECFNLINHFQRMFHGRMPMELLNSELEKMYNRADTKYKALKYESSAKMFLATANN